METMLVRFIPTDKSDDRGWTGNKPSLCFRGDRKAHCVIIKQEEIGTIDLPLDVVEKSVIVVEPGNPGKAYPPERFVKRVLESGKPLTPEARELLQSVNGQKKPLPPNQIKVKPDARGPTKTPLKTAGAELIIKLAQEWGLPTPKLRRYLRSQGCRAPYTDEGAIRKALKSLKKRPKK